MYLILALLFVLVLIFSPYNVRSIFFPRVILFISLSLIGLLLFLQFSCLVYVLLSFLSDTIFVFYFLFEGFRLIS